MLAGPDFSKARKASDMNENVGPAQMREVRPLREPDAPPRPQKRRWLRWLVALCLAAIAIIVFERWEKLAPGTIPSKKAEDAGPPPQTVRAAAAERGQMPITIDALGTVIPFATVTIRTQISGRLMNVGFTEGELVKKGDFLAQVDSRPYDAALAQAQGQLAKDTSLMQQAQANLARYQTLNRQDSIAKQQVDDQAFLVAQDKAAIAADNAQIDTAKLNIAYTRIVSPITGRVGLRLVDPGNYVQPSDANGIVVVTQLDPISVVFNTPEDNLQRISARLAAAEKLPVTVFDRANVEDAGDGRTDDLRQSDRHLDRHIQIARQLRQPRQCAVSQPVRQCAAARRHAERRRAGAQRGRATRAERPVRLCGQGRQDGRGAAGQDRCDRFCAHVIESGLQAGESVVVDGVDRLEGRRRDPLRRRQARRARQR